MKLKNNQKQSEVSQMNRLLLVSVGSVHSRVFSSRPSSHSKSHSQSQSQSKSKSPSGGLALANFAPLLFSSHLVSISSAAIPHLRSQMNASCLFLLALAPTRLLVGSDGAITIINRPNVLLVSNSVFQPLFHQAASEATKERAREPGNRFWRWQSAAAMQQQVSERGTVERINGATTSSNCLSC